MIDTATWLALSLAPSGGRVVEGSREHPAPTREDGVPQAVGAFGASRPSSQQRVSVRVSGGHGGDGRRAEQDVAEEGQGEEAESEGSVERVADSEESDEDAEGDRQRDEQSLEEETSSEEEQHRIRSPSAPTASLDWSDGEQVDEQAATVSRVRVVRQEAAGAPFDKAFEQGLLDQAFSELATKLKPAATSQGGAPPRAARSSVTVRVRGPSEKSYNITDESLSRKQ